MNLTIWSDQHNSFILICCFIKKKFIFIPKLKFSNASDYYVDHEAISSVFRINCLFYVPLLYYSMFCKLI